MGRSDCGAATSSQRLRTEARLALGVAGILMTLMSFSPSLNVFTKYMPEGVSFPSFAYVSLSSALLSCFLICSGGRWLGRLRFGRLRPGMLRKALFVACVACFVLGNATYALLPVFPEVTELVPWAWAAIAITVGLGSPAACLLWRREFNYVDVTTSVRVTALACVVYGAYLIVCSRAGLAFTIPAFLFATVAVVAVPLARKASADEPHATAEQAFSTVFRQAAPNLLPSVAGLAVFAFVMGFRRGGMDVDETDMLSYGFVVAGVLTAALSHVGFSESPIRHYYRTLLPLCATVLIPLSYIFSLAGAGTAAIFVIYVLFGVVGAFSLAAVAIFAQSDEFNGAKLVAAAFGIYNALSIVGLALVEHGSCDDTTQTIVFVGLSVAYFAFLGISPHLFAQEESAPETDAPRRAEGEDLAAACDEIARDGGLSPRETQIFALLARGFSATYISGALLISESTARTHVNNIYRKLDVASRDELLVMVDNKVEEARGR